MEPQRRGVGWDAFSAVEAKFRHISAQSFLAGISPRPIRRIYAVFAVGTETSAAAVAFPLTATLDALAPLVASPAARTMIRTIMISLRLGRRELEVGGYH